MENATERQRDVFEFITGFTAEYGRSPTIRDISRHFKISIGPVQKHVAALVKKGFLRHQPGISRGIELARRQPLNFIPIVGRVPAGNPWEALENIEGQVCVDQAAVRGGGHFALRVKGDSMTDAGIFEDDVVVVRRQPVAENNEIVVALVDGEATVKRFRKGKDGIFLVPANPKYAPIRSGSITIVGKVVYLTRKI